MQEVILFGSRARETHRERSDIDIAVYGGDFDSFYWDIKENVHSLLIFDIVEADEYISEELREEIERDVFRQHRIRRENCGRKRL